VINQRSIIIFNHAISSESTKIGYLNELKRFKEFYKIRDYDSLTTIEPLKLVFYGETKSSNTGCPNTSTRKPSITIPMRDKFLLIRFDLFI